MSLAFVRSSLHHSHAILALALIATGLVIEFPELRGRLLGGYGREIREIHLWVGWAFMAAPFLALAVDRRLWTDLRRRLGPPDPIGWRKIHIVWSLLSGVILSVSGIVLWLFDDLPLRVFDLVLDTHIAFTWVMIALLPMHVFMARHKLASSIRSWFGREPEPEWGFPFEDDEGPGPLSGRE